MDGDPMSTSVARFGIAVKERRDPDRRVSLRMGQT